MKSLPFASYTRQLNARRVITFALLILVTIPLLIEVIVLAPAMMNWRPNDYISYVYWGQTLRDGKVVQGYPLPSIFWFFLPLTFLPPQFAIVWAIAPFIFVLLICSRKGVAYWLYFPLLVQTGYAQLDGWLIVPLYWLFENQPGWAGVGAVLVLVKPTLAPLAVVYAVYRWLRIRDWTNLKWFFGTLVVFVLPAFVIDPLWPIHMFTTVAVRRAEEPNMVPRGASLWAWLWHGGITIVLIPLVALVILVLVIYIARHSKNLTATAEILNLIGVPYLYLSASTMLIPLYRTLPEMLILTIISWFAVGLDTLIGGWGGVYLIIPLAALVLEARRVQLQARTAMQPNPTE